jgi:PmbA protein
MIARQTVEKAIEGTQGAQATLSRSESVDVSFENDKLKSTQSSQRTQIDVRVIVDGKVGTSTTTDTGDLDGVVARALESAEYGSPVHFEFPGPQPGAEVEVYDERVPSVTQPEMIQVGQEMLELVKAYNPDILVGAEIGKRVTRTEFANSAGTAFVDENTHFRLSIGGELVRGTDILYAGHGYARRNRDIDHVAIARKAIEWFRMAEQIAPIESGDLPVIFTPLGLQVLLLSLGLGLDGKNVLLGASPLAGKMGEQIADRRFTLVDDPLIDYAANSSKYDGEGVPRQVTPLIQGGAVSNYLYDLDTAGRAGTRSTGHGPDRRPTNVVLRAGETPLAEMVKGIERGVLVHYVMGLGQGNAISGEFSVNLQLAYKIEGGEIVGRVKDAMLAGNVYDALQDIVAIGDEAEPVGGWFSGFLPYVQVGKLSVVAR